MPEPTSNRVSSSDRALWQGTRHGFDLIPCISALVTGFASLTAGGTGPIAFSVVCFAIAAFWALTMWHYAGRRLAVTPDGLALHGMPGARTLPWGELRHISLRMTGKRSLGKVTLSLATRNGASEVFSMRYVETAMFQQLADDLYRFLHPRGIPFIVESPDSVAAVIRMRTGTTPPPPPPGSARGLPD